MGTFCVHIHVNVPIIYYSHGLKCATIFFFHIFVGIFIGKDNKRHPESSFKVTSIRVNLFGTREYRCG